MAIEQLITCINQFAQQQSNPVLSVIPADGCIQKKNRYPDPILQFGHTGLRSYYHCHDMTGKPENEHGHFHIFIKLNQTVWSHLAGLSMDHYGQPLQWFTVNQWVSGESWGETGQLLDTLKKINSNSKQTLTEHWLTAMLSVYHNTLENLLLARDNKITKLTETQSNKQVLQDPAIYTLSACSIDLINDVQQMSNKK